MLTIQEENELIEKISSLTELEFRSLIESIKDHVTKNNLEQVISDNFELADSEEMDELNSEVSKLEEKIEELETENSRLERIIDQIRELV